MFSLICYIQSITEYYRVLQSIAEYYRVLQSITEYYRVLQSITKTNLAHLLESIFWLVLLEKTFPQLWPWVILDAPTLIKEGAPFDPQRSV